MPNRIIVPAGAKKEPKPARPIQRPRKVWGTPAKEPMVILPIKGRQKSWR